jgi:hypothetical protein
MATTPLTARKQQPALTPAEFYQLADVPPELEWFGNIRNPNTRKAYATNFQEFRAFVEIGKPEKFRISTAG